MQNSKSENQHTEVADFCVGNEKEKRITAFLLYPDVR